VSSLGSDVKTRLMAKESIQQEHFDLGEAGAQNMHRTQKKQEASDSAGQRRLDLRETNNNPFSYSLYNEHVGKEMLHEMEARKSGISPSATINTSQGNSEPVEATKEQKVSKENLRVENGRRGRVLPEFTASRDLNTSKGTTLSTGVLSELPTAKGSDRKATGPTATLTSGSILNSTEVEMPGHNLRDPEATGPINPKTPERIEIGKGKAADLAEPIHFRKPATTRGEDGQGREQVVQAQDMRGSVISRPSRASQTHYRPQGLCRKAELCTSSMLATQDSFLSSLATSSKLCENGTTARPWPWRPDREILARTILQTPTQRQ
jgi:hypothetical protein